MGLRRTQSPDTDARRPGRLRRALLALSRLVTARVRPAVVFLAPVLLLQPLAGLSNPLQPSSGRLLSAPAISSLENGGGAVLQRLVPGASMASPSGDSALAMQRLLDAKQVAGKPAPDDVAGGFANAENMTPTERLLLGAEMPDDGREQAAMGEEEAKAWLRARGKGRAQQVAQRAVDASLASGVQWLTSRFSGDAPVRIDSTLGWDFREGVLGGMEVFFPFAHTESSTWFLQPGFLVWPGERGERRHDVNIGLGRRALLNEDLALGAAIFYDYNVDEGHSRLGLSADLQGSRLYGALNIYAPLSGWRAGSQADGVLYQERSLAGGELRLHHALTERLEVFGSANLWREYQARTGRSEGWKPGGSVGLKYRVARGLALTGHYEIVEGAGDSSRYSLWMDWTVPAAADAVFSHRLDLYRPVERERRLLYAEREGGAALGACRVPITISHDRMGESVSAGQLVRFTGLLNGGQSFVRCAGLPARLEVREPATGVVLAFVDADDNGVFDGPEGTATGFVLAQTGGETEATADWTVPALAELPDGLYDPDRSGLVFAFAVAGDVGSAEVMVEDPLSVSLPMGTVLPPAVAFGENSRSQQVFEARYAEAAGMVEVPVSLSESPAVDTTFALTASGSATEGTDYTLTASSLTFVAGGATTQELTITLLDDTTEEVDETLEFAWQAGTDPYSRRNTARLVITSEDADPSMMPVLSFTRDRVRGREGEDIMLGVQLSRALTAPGSVDVSTTAGSASAGEDYTAPANTLTLAAGETRFTIVVPTEADQTVEGEETLTVTLAAPVSAAWRVGAQASITVRIIDDETPAIAFGPSAQRSGDYTATVAESAGMVEVPVTVSRLPAVATDFAYTLEGTATAGTDYTAPSGTVNFTPGGSLTQTITITLTDDTDAEPDETLTLRLASPGTGLEALYGRRNAATITLAANDQVLSFVSDTATVLEGGSVTLALQLSPALAVDSSVNVVVTPGTAAADADYTPLASTLALSAGTESFSLVLATVDDLATEGNETLTVMLSTPADAPYLLGATSAVEVTILDDDLPMLAFTAATAEVAEGEELTLEVQLSEALAGANSATVSAVAGTATLTDDYTAPAATLALAAMTTDFNIVLTTVEDRSTEANETLTIRLAVPAAGSGIYILGARAEIVVTILDDDSPGVSVNPTGLTLDEGEMDEYELVLNTQPSGNVTVTVASSDVGAATVSATMLEFTTTNWETGQTVTVTAVEENNDFADERVSIRHTASSSDSNYNPPPAISPVQVAITDNDLPSLMFTQATARVAEGSTAMLALALNGALATGSSVTVAVSASTASAAADYTAPGNTFTLGPGTRDFTLALATRNDNLVEGEETVTLMLTAPDRARYMIGAQASIEVTITDDEATASPTIAFGATAGATSNYTRIVAEAAGELLIPVTVSALPGEATAFAYTLGGNAMEGDDFASITTKTVNFAPTDAGTTQTLTINLNDDDLVEADESLTITLAAAGSGIEALYARSNSVAITITSEDTAPVLRFAAASSAIAEGATATLSMTLSRALTAASSVDLELNLGTAEAADYTPLGFASVDITTSATTITFALETVDDSLVEEADTLSFTLSAPAGAEYVVGSQRTTTLSITDDEAAANPTIAFGATTGDTSNLVVTHGEEDGALEVVVTLSALPEASTAFAYTLGGDAVEGADFASIATKSVSFEDTGNLTRTITITPTDDIDVEADESLSIAFAARTGLAGLYTASNSAAITLTSEDLPTLDFAELAADVVEGETANLVLTLNSALSAPSSVAVATTAGSAGTGDFTSPAASFALAANTLRFTLAVASQEDALVEPDETLTVGLSAVMSAPYMLGITDTFGLNITDDETPTVAFGSTAGSMTNYTATVAETDGAVQIPLILSNAGSEGLVFVLDFAGTATRGSTGDYTASEVSGSTALVLDSMSGNPTATTGNYAITLRDDTDAEINESLEIFVSATQASDNLARRYTPTNRAVLTVTSEDTSATPVLGFVSNRVPVAEGQAATLTVALSSTLATSSSVQVATTAGTATNVVDYTAPPTTLALGMGVSSVTLTVATGDDSLAEDDETLTVTLAAISSAPYTLAQASATVVIVNDDTLGVGLNRTTLTVDEGGMADYTAVLNSQPAGDVLVAVASSDVLAATVSPAMLRFTRANWMDAQTVVVRGVEDSDFANETVSIRHTATSTDDSEYNGVAVDSVAVTVTDNDLPPLMFTTASTSVMEGETATLRLSLAQGLDETGSVNVAVNRDTTEPGDFDAPPATFMLGAGATQFTLTVDTMEDTVVEGNETFTVTLSAPAGARYEIGTRNAFEVTITDDEMPTVAFGSTAGATAAYTDTVAEADGDVEVVVTINALPEANITIPFAVSGTADEGADYATITPKSVTFMPTGALTRTLTISLTDDTAPEPNETLSLAFAAPGSGLQALYQRSNTATLTLTSEDLPTLSLDQTTAQVTEGEMLRLGLTLNAALSAGSSVNVAVTTTEVEPEDYTALSATFALAQNMTSFTLVLSTIEDRVFEGNESLRIVLTAIADAPYMLSGTANAVSVQIVDDETSPTIAFGSDATATGNYMATAAEIAGGAELRVPVTVSALPATAVNFAYTVGGTADEGDDYANIATKAVRFTPTDANLTQTITITVRDDAAVEPDESLSLTLTRPASGPGAAYTVNNTAALTITSDDLPPQLGFTATTASIAEGSIATLSVALDRALADGSSATVGVTLGTAASNDFTAPATTLTLTEGVSSFAVMVTTAVDALVEADETLTVTLTAPGNAPYAVSQGSVALTIEDDEADASPSLAFGATTGDTNNYTATVAESAGTVEVQLTLSALPGADTEFPVRVSGTATRGADYQAPPASVRFTPTGALTRTLTITLIDDTNAEENETLTLSLGAAGAGLERFYTGTNAAVITITSEDTMPDLPTSLGFATGQGTVTEGGVLSITVELSEALDTASSVNISVERGTASTSDYRAPVSRLALGRGATRFTLTLATRQDTTAREGDETLTLVLGAPSNAPYVLAGNTAFLVIIADDDGGTGARTRAGQRPIVSFGTTVNNNQDLTVRTTEGRVVAVPITTNSLPARGISTAIDTIVGNYQYVEPIGGLIPQGGTPATLRIRTQTIVRFEPNGPTTINMFITIPDDNTTEPEEVANLTLPAIGIQVTNSAQLRIADNDTAPVLGFGRNASSTMRYTASHSESAGAITVPITMNHLPSREAFFALTVSGNAVEGADYGDLRLQAADLASISDSVRRQQGIAMGDRFVRLQPSGSLTQNLIITLNDDTFSETPKTITLRLQPNASVQPDNFYTLNNREAVITIVDDDTMPRLALAATPTSTTVNEANGPVRLMLELEPALSSPSLVQLRAVDGTTEPGDYRLPATLTLPARQTRIPLEVGIVNDELVDFAGPVSEQRTHEEARIEQFTVQLVAIDNAPYGLDPQADEHVITIDDDERPYITSGPMLRPRNAAGAYAAGSYIESQQVVRLPYTVSHLPESPAIFTWAVRQSGTFGPVRARDIPGTLFRSASNQLVFRPSGSRTQNISLTLIDDNVQRRGNSVVNATVATGPRATNTGSVNTMVNRYLIFSDTNLASTDAQFSFVDNDGVGPLALSFDRASHILDEPDGSITLGLGLGVVSGAARVLETASSVRVSVNAAGSDTATAGADYTAPASTLTLPRHQGRFSITVPIANDTLTEGTETFSVTLTAVARAPYTLGQATTTITIRDDDIRQAAFGTSDATSVATYMHPVVMEDAGNITVPVIVNRLPATSTTFTAQVLSSGTAVEDTDFSFTDKTVTFGTSGSLTRNLNLSLIDNEVAERIDRTIHLGFASCPSNFQCNNGARLTIRNEDIEITMTQTQSFQVTEGASATIPLSLSAPLPTASSLNVTAMRGSARAGDYNAPTTLTLPANTRTVNLVVATVDDRLDEGREQFSVTISRIDNAPYVLGSITTAFILINDND